MLFIVISTFVVVRLTWRADPKYSRLFCLVTNICKFSCVLLVIYIYIYIYIIKWFIVQFNFLFVFN